MLGKHIKAVSLMLAICLIAVMFLLVMIFNGNVEVYSQSSAVILLLFVVAASVVIFAAHEKHN